MTSPSEIAELLAETCDGVEIDERFNILVSQVVLDNKLIREKWLHLVSNPPEYLTSITINGLDTDAELTDEYEPIHNELFRLTLLKKMTDDQICMFFGSEIHRIEAQLSTVSSVRVATLSDNGTFTTERSRYCKWVLDAAENYNCSELLVDPRKFSQDFTNQNHVTEDIRPWIIRSEPVDESDAYLEWKRISSRKLIAALTNQVTLKENILHYSFNGPPVREFHIDDAKLVPLMPRLMESARWVFVNVQDSEVRHLFIASEWARSLNVDDFGSGAFESAKRTYEAYAKATGKDTLKALSELRKSVLEESQKIADRAHGLARALWKDLAIAASPFVLKVFSQADKTQSYIVAAVFAYVAAIFLFFAFVSQVYLNSQFFKSQKTARETWNRPLLDILSNDELNEFVDKPIASGLSDYKLMRFLVGVIYLALFSALCWFGTVNLLNYNKQKLISNPAPEVSIDTVIDHPQTTLPMKQGTQFSDPEEVFQLPKDELAVPKFEEDEN